MGPQAISAHQSSGISTVETNNLHLDIQSAQSQSEIIHVTERLNIARAGNGKDEDLSEEQLNLIDELYDQVAPLRGSLHHPHDTDFCDHETCRRYLVARSWNMKKAEDQLISTLKWRANEDPGRKEFWESSRCYDNPLAFNMRLVGWDLKGRPIGYTCFRQAHDRFDPDSNLEHVELVLEALSNFLKARRKRDYNTTAESRQCIWVVDFDGFAFGDTNPKTALMTAKLLQHYPEMLSMIILIDPPFIFNALWNMVAPILDARIRNKIMFVKGKDAGELLRKRLGEEAATWIAKESKDNHESIAEIKKGYPKRYWIQPTEKGQHDARGFETYVQSEYYVKTPGDAYEERKVSIEHHIPIQPCKAKSLYSGNFDWDTGAVAQTTTTESNRRSNCTISGATKQRRASRASRSTRGGLHLVCMVSLLVLCSSHGVYAFTPSDTHWGPHTVFRNDDAGDAHRPIPAMPSELFQDLAMSQLELLANSLRRSSSHFDGNTKNNKNNNQNNQNGHGDDGPNNDSKIKSMALYLPQENVNTGQLEFLPVVVYPHPSTERVFIASDASAKVAPTLPKILTKLPGFAAPNSLLPRYPMVSSSASGGVKNSQEYIGVGVVEEVLCDVQSGAPALSVPLFLGSQTVGVLLVSPVIPSRSASATKRGKKIASANIWTANDREQIARAARTLSMALNMDTERSNLEIQNNRIKDSLSDSLHQVKNPLQALRTFGKLLQRRVASAGEEGAINNQIEVGTTTQLLELTQNMMVQSDRVVNLLAPIDSLVSSLEDGNQQRYLNPAAPLASTGIQSIVPWDEANPPSLPWESDTIEFARRETNNTIGVSSPSLAARSNFPSTATKSVSNVNNNERGTGGTIEFSHRRQPSQGGGMTRAQNVTFSSAPTSTAKTPLSPQKPSFVSYTRPAAPQVPTSTPSSSSQPPSPPSVVGVDDEAEMTFILDVLEPIFSLYQAIGAEKGISFEVLGLDIADELPGVMIGRKALQEAVSNLLDNAFKYGSLPRDKGEPKNPNPCVRVRLMPNNSREMPAGCSLVVEDNGPGVTPLEAAVIFDRGFRSPTTSSQAEGTGIGLDISRSLLRSMGGTLECLVRSDQGGRKRNKSTMSPELLDGAVFRVSLFRNKT